MVAQVFMFYSHSMLLSKMCSIFLAYFSFGSRKVEFFYDICALDGLESRLNLLEEFKLFWILL